MAHWVYIFSAASSPIGFAVWRCAPKALLMLIGELTKDPQHSKQCAEMLRLQRRDAKELPSYFGSPETHHVSPNTGAARPAPEAPPSASGHSSPRPGLEPRCQLAGSGASIMS
jgi:hypothetical protein